MHSKTLLALAALLAGTSIATSASAATSGNLLTNGSFENPNVVGGGSYVLYTSGSTAITGWTVLAPTSGESIQLTPDTYLGLKASDGRQWIDMTGISGYDKGLRSDAIATTVGQTYRIAFDLGNYLPFGASTLGLRLNGGAETLYTNPLLTVTATNPMNWTQFSVDWVADSTSLQLSFFGRANGALSNNLGIGLDNVSVSLASAVPEPAGAGLMALGAALLLSRRRAAAFRG